MADNNPHPNSNQQNNADLYHGNAYRQKGHKEIKGSGRKSRYNKTNQIKAGLAKLPFPRVPDRAETSHAKRYHFAYGKNFTHYRIPYYNQAHHMLPQEFWDPLDSEQKAILRTLKYSINNGKNIVFLPANNTGWHIHKLPKHNGSHPTYSRAVLKDSKAIKKDLNKAVREKKKCETYTPPQSILEKLMQLQNDYWDIITASKEDAINNVIQPTTQTQESDV
ncbi:MAG: AHH domain-containing protein [Gammaproteobacteria bacterium]|nr:AHH domain-containing protein [Gammaproteobacteria bacterium]